MMGEPPGGADTAAGGGEFALIQRHLSGLGRDRPDVVLGPGDDAAIVSPPQGRDLVLTLDTLVAGRHFPVSLPAADVGRRLMAVNLSDLAAMGAEPAWATLSVAIPEPDEAWLAEFARGLGDLADRHGVAVVGGDLVRGPLTVSAQLSGFSGPEAALRRTGAAAGDDIWVSGTLGGAMAVLDLQVDQVRALHPDLYARFASPEPRLALGRRLAGLATSAIDISDGLLADLGHILKASRLGAEIVAETVPLHPVAAQHLPPARALELALTGGDDYELCFTTPPDRAAAVLSAAEACGTPVSRIGRCRTMPGLAVTRAGQPLALDRSGWDHFEASS
jgi:thiamine-monophosphate kinase